GWNDALAYSWEGGHASGALARAKVRPMLLASHGELARLCGDRAADIPQASPRLEIELHLDDPPRASLAGGEDWAPRDPFADPGLLAEINLLRDLDHRPLETDDRGLLA